MIQYIKNYIIDEYISYLLLCKILTRVILWLLYTEKNIIFQQKC